VIAQLDALLPPTAEPVSPEDLRSLVEGLAGSPGLWASRVRHDPEARIFELLWTDPRVDVWLICWSGQDHDTGFHDHDVSSGAFAVVRGELVEERLTVGAPVRRRLRRGQSLSFPPSHVHRVQGVGTVSAVSIHAYSPPLVRMGVYGVADDGTLRREAVGATHELRLQGGPA
jgi:mannose-6-phosphate isomerase-like protein (cupin superfamily)